MLKLARNLELPLEFVTERIAFLARTGAGKSGGMRVLAEQMIEAGQFVIVIDPKGDAWGIRASGSGAGLPVMIMGGEHADVPLQATAGKFVAEFLVKERISCVLDTSEFGKADLNRFVAAFGERFFRLNRDVVHIFIDEIDMVAGQQFYEPHTLEAIQHLQTKGRQRGIGLTFASNRSQLVNKTVLDASGTMIAMQATSPRSLKAIREWLEGSADKAAVDVIMPQLPQLKTREAFIYSPQFLGPEPKRIAFNGFKTFDSMETPKPGEKRQQPKRLADINLAAVQKEMAATIEESKANDPAELKKQIRELQQKLNAKPKAESDPDEIKRAVDSAVAVERRAWVPIVDAAERTLKTQRELLDKIAALAQQNGVVLKIERPVTAHNLGHNLHPKTPLTFANSKPETRCAPSKRDTAADKSGQQIGDLKINAVQQRILDTLAWYESIGQKSPSNTKIGAVALIDPTGGYFSNMVGPLSSAGYIDRGKGFLTLTDAGRAIAKLPESVASLSEYHETLKARVLKMKSAAKKTADVLDAIIGAGGNPITTAEIGEQIGVDHTGGYFSNLIGPISTAGLITRSGGTVTPTDVLFPEGLY